MAAQPDVANNNYLKADDDNDDDDSNSDENLPYQSLQNCNGSSLKRYASFTNLNALTEDEDDSNRGMSPESTTNERQATTTSHSVMSWANRATTFVAQKVALFEKIGENVQNSSFLDRCVRASIS